MIKKSYRLISGFLAVAMLITGCDANRVVSLPGGSNSTDGSSSGSTSTSTSDSISFNDVSSSPDSATTDDNEFSYELYTTSPVTQVTNKTYSINNSVGSYTGEWKGNRPEGEGVLAINEDEYYRGIWKNGYLHGQCEIFLHENDDITKYYRGECEYNQPSGNGIMYCIVGDDNLVCYQGDFSDTGDMCYYTFVDNGKILTDIGQIVDGKHVSYINDNYFSGKEYLPEEFKFTSDKYGYVDSFITKQKSEFFGAYNSSGLPHGYGYLKITNTLTGKNGKENQKMYVDVLGNWENGKLTGYVTYIERIEGEVIEKKSSFFGGTKETVKTYSHYVKKYGQYQNGHFYGNFSTDYYYSGDYVVQNNGIFLNTEINEVDPNSYQLYSDGLYRTDYELESYYLPNGKYSEKKRRYVCKDINNISERYAEGEYFVCDDKGRTLDYGESDKNGTHWKSTMPEEEKQKGKISVEELDKIGILLIAGIGIAALAKTYYDINTGDPSDPAFKYVAEAKRRSIEETEKYHREKEIFNDYMRQAQEKRSEAEREDIPYKQKQLYQEAENLERKASEHSMSIFW